ncbi:hypothetical protein DFJ73DRAFT_866622 [Zopfochytrium polystomum]|nr:hypothetical protein DFJ73DRAFT_866622 [Zopfochytrium polystomum]
MAQRERETTRDGYEAQFAVNHLGHFHLVRKLSPLLARSGSTAAPSRVVNLSSVTHVMFAPNEGILFDDINGEKDYQNWVRYGHAKLATVLFSHELNKRFKAAGEHVQSVALHPGIIKTDLYAHTHEGTGKEQMMQGHFFKLPLYLFDWSKSVPQGAATTVVCALDPGLKAGGYYKDCRPSNETHVLAFDDTQAARLWAVSEEMVDKALKANRGRI